MIWRYSGKRLQITPKSDTFIFFSKTALTIFLFFDLKLVANMTFNLNETYFSKKFAIWRYLTSKLATFGVTSKLCNLKMADPFFCLFLFWFSSVKLVFSYHFHVNVTRSTQKLPFRRFLTLKMVPKPFRNYPKIRVLGQFFKDSSRGFCSLSPVQSRCSCSLFFSFSFISSFLQLSPSKNI